MSDVASAFDEQTAQYLRADKRAPAEPRETQHLLLRWYRAHARDLPWRRTSDSYAILVSEIMLQQTQAERVAPKYEQFLARFPTLASLAAASTAEVIRAWAPLGYNRRAVNLQRLARIVTETDGGRLPSEARALRALPGIGRYTAAAVACFAFGRREPVIDTNVRRVLARLHGEASAGERQTEALAERYLPDERATDWNQALMDLGATICKAATPTCPLCPLRAVCPSCGLVVHERRATYRADGRSVPFASTDRYLRGRIVDLLRTLPSSTSLTRAELEQRLPRVNGEDAERLPRLLRALQRDGLIVIEDRPDDQILLRLPE